VLVLDLCDCIIAELVPKPGFYFQSVGAIHHYYATMLDLCTRETAATDVAKHFIKRSFDHHASRFSTSNPPPMHFYKPFTFLSSQFHEVRSLWLS
jgi:hypothetical protein